VRFFARRKFPFLSFFDLMAPSRSGDVLFAQLVAVFLLKEFDDFFFLLCQRFFPLPFSVFWFARAMALFSPLFWPTGLFRGRDLLSLCELPPFPLPTFTVRSFSGQYRKIVFLTKVLNVPLFAPRLAGPFRPRDVFFLFANVSITS